ncbi:MAG TPA: cupin domain-containing protein [Solirubrobacteraceae bacterium]|jgi:quercetin dioxygenase-like cupin family protein
MASVEERAAEGITGNYELTPLECAAAVSLEFKDGARSYWHTHPGVQTLICVGGKGRVVYDSGETFELVPGAVVTIPEGIKHWHGADAGSDMTHVALNPAGLADLLEPVTD